MKNMFFIFSAAATFLFSSCKKSGSTDCTSSAPTTVATAGEITTLQNYLTANAITATQHPNGVFYVINSQGTGTSPNLCSNIKINYRGNVLNSAAAFDSTSVSGPRTFVLNGLIAGWQLVLPLVKSGGSVSLYIPPSLGYGSTDHGAIPGNSYLKFNIDLISAD